MRAANMLPMRHIASGLSILIAIWFLWFYFAYYSTNGPLFECQLHPGASDSKSSPAVNAPSFPKQPAGTGEQNENEAASPADPSDAAASPSPSAPSELRRSKIGKVTVALGGLDSPLISRAMKTHQKQNEIHGYEHFLAPYPAVSELIEHDSQNRPKGAWSKPAYLMSIIVAELEKPEEERLEWIYWFDADTVILNPYTPLEIFLPSGDDQVLKDIKFLIASNWDGLNSGVFALRVDPWSASLLGAVTAYPIYMAEKYKKDKFRDQSAFQWLLEAKDSPLAVGPDKGQSHWATVPMRWFNSLPFNNAWGKNGHWILADKMTEKTFDNGTDQVYDDGMEPKVQPWKVMQGDMVVHFAGSSGVRPSWMNPWMDRAEEMLPQWANETTQDSLKVDIKNFYDDLVKTRSAKKEEEKKVESSQEKKGKRRM